MNIGIYAGTFDPIHSGHTEFAEAAIKSCQLDKVVIVAEKEPYRKKPHVHWDHRQAMIERATQDISAADHDYRFADQLAHRHTMADMLLRARKHYGENNRFWFLVGSDIFEHMHRWHDVVSQSEYEGFIVSLRDEHNNEWLESKKQLLYEAHAMRVHTVVVPNSHPHISSSGIRRAIQSGEPVDDVNSKVLKYIQEHGLYSAKA